MVEEEGAGGLVEVGEEAAGDLVDKALAGGLVEANATEV